MKNFRENITRNFMKKVRLLKDSKGKQLFT